MALAELAGRLALDRHTPRTIIAKLRGLARHSGLPLPRNPRFVDGKPVPGANSIYSRSLWDRGEILAWLDNGITPTRQTAPIAPAAAQREEATRAHLADRAVALMGGIRRRVAG